MSVVWSLFLEASCYGEGASGWMPFPSPPHQPLPPPHALPPPPLTFYRKRNFFTKIIDNEQRVISGIMLLYKIRSLLQLNFPFSEQSVGYFEIS